jgi:acyl carrier protein
MTVESTEAGTADPQLFAELTGILLQVTGAGAEWAAGITPNARMEVDLGMESIELAALGELLAERYGAGVDLAAFYAGLDIDQVIGLTVAGVVDYVDRTRRVPPAGPIREPA